MAQIPVHADTGGLDLDRRTRTLYVTHFADAPGSVSVVDTRACHGRVTSGCDQQWPTTPVGRNPWSIVVDQRSHRVFTADFKSATVSIIDGAACNATNRRGCGRTPPRVAVGNLPFDLALDRDTLYTANAPDLDVSIVDLRGR